MFKMFKKKEVIEDVRSFGSPVDGEIIAISNVHDQVFSSKAMGDGFGVEPQNGRIYSPVSGEVTVVFPTGHAYGLKLSNGIEILIHLGIDTVNLNGEGFSSKVKQGETVKEGDLLCEMDISFIEEKGLETTCMVILTSGQNIEVDHIGEQVTHNQETVLKIKN